MNKNSLLTTIIITIVVGVIGFYAGKQYQNTQCTTGKSSTRINNQQGGPPGQMSGTSGQTNGQNGPMGNNAPVSGEITSQDSQSITIKMQDGSTKIIILSNSTKIIKTTDGTASDLKTGQKVTVMGSESNGSITAQTISLGNGFNGMGGQKPDGQPSTNTTNK